MVTPLTPPIWMVTAGLGQGAVVAGIRTLVLCSVPGVAQANASIDLLPGPRVVGYESVSSHLHPNPIAKQEVVS